MRQIETSRTLVFDAPPPRLRGLRSPGRRQHGLRSPGQLEDDLHRSPRTPGTSTTVELIYKTKIVTRGTDVTVNVFFKHSRIMSYELGRLRLNGLIERIGGTNTYLPTADGQRIAIFYSKVHNRLLCPLLAADAPPVQIEPRRALHAIDRHVHGYIGQARLGNTA